MRCEEVGGQCLQLLWTPSNCSLDWGRDPQLDTAGCVRMYRLDAPTIASPQTSRQTSRHQTNYRRSPARYAAALCCVTLPGLDPLASRNVPRVRHRAAVPVYLHASCREGCGACNDVVKLRVCMKFRCVGTMLSDAGHCCALLASACAPTPTHPLLTYMWCSAAYRLGSSLNTCCQ